MLNNIRRALVAVITGMVTVAGGAVLMAPAAHAATPYFTGTSTCNTVTGEELITYAVPHPLGTFTTGDITAVNTVYTKVGTATIFTSVPVTTYPTAIAGDTLTMTVPGSVSGTYRVNLTVAITTATGTDWIAVVADTTVAGTCTITPPEVLPTTITISPAPSTAAPTTAAPTSAAPTTAAPTTTAPSTAGSSTAAPTVPGTVQATSAPATQAGVPTASSVDPEVKGANLTLAQTGADVDEPLAILGVASLVGGGALLLFRRRS